MCVFEAIIFLYPEGSFRDAAGYQYLQTLKFFPVSPLHPKTHAIHLGLWSPTYWLHVHVYVKMLNVLV